jgi:hypothetical protein
MAWIATFILTSYENNVRVEMSYLQMMLNLHTDYRPTPATFTWLAVGKGACM